MLLDFCEYVVFEVLKPMFVAAFFICLCLCTQAARILLLKIVLSRCLGRKYFGGLELNVVQVLLHVMICANFGGLKLMYVG